MQNRSYGLGLTNALKSKNLRKARPFPPCRSALSLEEQPCLRANPATMCRLPAHGKDFHDGFAG